MITEIENLVTPEELARLRALFDQAPKQDGKKSAGVVAVRVKSNVELVSDTPEFQEMTQIFNNALKNSKQLEHTVMPVQHTMALYGCYTAGMSYGEHLDNAIASFNPNPFSAVFDGRFRADVSATLFLSEPDEYEGGELVINSPSGMNAIKCAAGNMIVYPSGYLHRIAEVTSGMRRVAVLWFQSYVRDPERRYMLNRILMSNSALINKYPGDPDVQTMNFVYNNLLRMWADAG